MIPSPVVAGGIYKETTAPQGASGSATDVMCSAKQILMAEGTCMHPILAMVVSSFYGSRTGILPRPAPPTVTSMPIMTSSSTLCADLARQARRYRVPLHSQLMEHPRRKTLSAMRLISASPEGSIRVRLTHALYKVGWLTCPCLSMAESAAAHVYTECDPPQAYWCENADVESVTVLQQIADSIHWEVSVGTVIGSDQVKGHLIANTKEAAQRGAFGVPRSVVDKQVSSAQAHAVTDLVFPCSFFAGDKLFYGTDRMFLVERYLGNLESHPHRLATIPSPSSRRLTFYFDYSSPFSYLGCVQVDRLCQSYPMLQVEYVPVLLGALLKAVGTSVVGWEVGWVHRAACMQGVPLLPSASCCAV